MRTTAHHVRRSTTTCIDQHRLVPTLHPAAFGAPGDLAVPMQSVRCRSHFEDGDARERRQPRRPERRAGSRGKGNGQRGELAHDGPDRRRKHRLPSIETCAGPRTNASWRRCSALEEFHRLEQQRAALTRRCRPRSRTRSRRRTGPLVKELSQRAQLLKRTLDDKAALLPDRAERVRRPGRSARPVFARPPIVHADPGA